MADWYNEDEISTPSNPVIEEPEIAQADEIIIEEEEPEIAQADEIVIEEEEPEIAQADEIVIEEEEEPEIAEADEIEVDNDSNKPHPALGIIIDFISGIGSDIADVGINIGNVAVDLFVDFSELTCECIVGTVINNLGDDIVERAREELQSQIVTEAKAQLEYIDKNADSHITEIDDGHGNMIPNIVIDLSEDEVEQRANDYFNQVDAVFGRNFLKQIALATAISEIMRRAIHCGSSGTGTFGENQNIMDTISAIGRGEISADSFPIENLSRLDPSFLQAKLIVALRNFTTVKFDGDDPNSLSPQHLENKPYLKFFSQHFLNSALFDELNDFIQGLTRIMATNSSCVLSDNILIDLIIGNVSDQLDQPINPPASPQSCNEYVNLGNGSGGLNSLPGDVQGRLSPEQLAWLEYWSDYINNAGQNSSTNFLLIIDPCNNILVGAMRNSNSYVLNEVITQDYDVSGLWTVSGDLYLNGERGCDCEPSLEDYLGVDIYDNEPGYPIFPGINDEIEFPDVVTDYILIDQDTGEITYPGKKTPKISAVSVESINQTISLVSNLLNSGISCGGDKLNICDSSKKSEFLNSLDEIQKQYDKKDKISKQLTKIQNFVHKKQKFNKKDIKKIKIQLKKIKRRLKKNLV